MLGDVFPPVQTSGQAELQFLSLTSLTLSLLHLWHLVSQILASLTCLPWFIGFNAEMCDMEIQVWCSADSCLLPCLPILKVCPARIPGSHSWGMDADCHSWWEEKDDALKERDARLHTFSRLSRTNKTRRDIARNGSSLSVLPPPIFSRERTSKLKIWHLDRWLKLIAHTCYFCQHGVLDQAVACAYFYRPWAQTQLLNKHVLGKD